MKDQDTKAPMMRLCDDQKCLVLSGDYVLETLPACLALQKGVRAHFDSLQSIDLLSLAALDSAGALFLYDLVAACRRLNPAMEVLGLSGPKLSLYEGVEMRLRSIRAYQPPSKRESFFSRVGRWAVEKYEQLTGFLSFVGELSSLIIKACLQPRKIAFRATFKIMETSGYHALPIIALMLFLIGVVLAYQLVIELKMYGADIFVVDVSGIAILREFGPLITAIIMAGRTSTSFAALLGMMKVNEEVDALKTMGVVPLERLVLPRVFGLMLAMPLLAVWADAFGVSGAMVMSNSYVGISYLGFLERFGQVVALKQFLLGLIKTPVFALVIATVGCFQGFSVGSSADSVGWNTTKSAVQSIFLIIVVDAGFSILYSTMGL